MRRTLRPGVVELVAPQPDLPEPLKDATIAETCDISSLSGAAELRQWLQQRGLDTSKWGSGNTKTVDKLWAELEGAECGLEFWRGANGEGLVVRTTHVLRAKVCSPDSYKRNLFLLNTWQQFADGRKRIRNGLLSEKLSTTELPLHENLHAVCERAVTQEEMQRVAEALFKIVPDTPLPTFDPTYKCPIEVIDEFFADYVIEVEESKSYPELRTMYHLYTVDIVCKGLPTVDFNTLEFDHEDSLGCRKLKYVHAWVWKEWAEVQRYLFEGSSLKERKTKGSFTNASSLRSWLLNFHLDLSSWGQKGWKDHEALFNELENEETQLELWNKNDGVPLLMRVVHVLQMKVSSTDPRLSGKFLYNSWTQTADGHIKTVNRLFSMKLRTHMIPLDLERITQEAKKSISQDFSYFRDALFSLDPNNLPEVAQLEHCDVRVTQVRLLDHHVDVEQSPSYKGLCTLYHLYGSQVECDNLPQTNFTSLEVLALRQDGARWAEVDPYVNLVFGWCWVTWPQCLDMVHSHVRDLEGTLSIYDEALSRRRGLVSTGMQDLERLAKLAADLTNDPMLRGARLEDCNAFASLVAQLQEGYRKLATSVEEVKAQSSNVSVKAPPAVVSEIAEKTIIKEDVLKSSKSATWAS